MVMLHGAFGEAPQGDLDPNDEAPDDEGEVAHDGWQGHKYQP